MMGHIPMRFANLLFAAVTTVAAAFPAGSGDEWVHLTTPHFEIYTTAGEKKGRDAVLYFEQVRSFVTEITHAAWNQPVPVRIVAFKSEKEFRPYAPNGAAAAWFAATQSRDYIVMEDVDSEHFPIAIHEYMHLVVQHSGMKLPTWLNEGWADVFSTLRPSGKDAVIGEVLRGHVKTLANEKWLDFETLTSANESSRNYKEKSRAGVFYAEGWALAHMMYLSRDYHDGFGKFLVALNEGKTTTEALQIVYNRAPEKVFADLQAYLWQNTINRGVFPAKLEKSAEEATLVPVSSLDSGVLIADLLAASGKRDDARTAYEALAKQFPGTSDISKSLGYLAWQHGDTETARKYFEEALPNATDPQMCYHLATLYHSAQADKAVVALLKALRLKPDYTDARLQLGFAELNLKNYPGAIASFIQLQHVTPEHAAMLFNGLAYAYAQTGDFDKARKNLTNALKWEKTDDDKERANQLTRYLDARDDAAKRNAPPDLTEYNPFVLPGEKVERIEGEARTVECTGDHATLVVEVGASTMSFQITDPNRIMLKHEGAETFQFSCGPQKKFHVAVEYVPDITFGPGVAGSVRKIEF
jgi:Flp pilus assembly protein TadD